MRPVLLFIYSILLATASYGQKVVGGYEIYNGDTIRYNKTKPGKDTLASVLPKIATDTLKNDPVKPDKEVQPVMQTLVKKEPVKIKKDKPEDAIVEDGPPIANNDLMGKWQMESTEVADGYYYTYSFLRGNNFIFGNDENEGLNRIISLRGTYYLKNDTLILYLKQEYDLVGGNPQLSEKLAGSGWVVKGGKVVPKDLSVVKEYKIPVRPCAERDGKRCLEINSMSYYKLQ